MKYTVVIEESEEGFAVSVPGETLGSQTTNSGNSFEQRRRTSGWTGAAARVLDDGWMVGRRPVIRVVELNRSAEEFVG